MSQHDNHSQKMKQTPPCIQNNQQQKFKNIQMIESKEDLEIDFNKIQFQLSYEEQKNVKQILNGQKDFIQYTQQSEQEFEDEDDDEDYEDLKIKNIDRNEYIYYVDCNLQYLMNQAKDLNHQYILPDGYQISSNQQIYQNEVNTQSQDQFKQQMHKDCINSNSKNTEQKVSLRQYKNNKYQDQEQDQENENQDTRLMNLTTQLNIYINNRSAQTNNKGSQLSSLCEKNTMSSHLNSFQSPNINSAGVLNFQSSNKQNMKQLSLLSDKQQEEQIQIIDTFHNKYNAKQLNQKNEQNNEKEKFEYQSKFGSQQLCADKSQIIEIEGITIDNDYQSQRSALKEKFVPENSQQASKVIDKEKYKKKVSCQNFLQCQQTQIYQNNQDILNCNFCKNQYNFFFDCNQIVSHLYSKYASSQNYYYTRDLNEILNNYRSKAAINQKDSAMLDEDAEYLKRYYNRSEYPKKSKLLTEYYKFHKDIPRLFMLPETYVLNNFHDKQRRLDYYKIAQMIEEENKLNPNRPPKGIVGEKPQLRTNESSEDIKQQNLQNIENIQQDKNSEMFLVEISSFINRGQGRLDSNLSDVEDEHLVLQEEGKQTQRCLQTIKPLIQNEQSIENQLIPISLKALKQYGKKEQINQNINEQQYAQSQQQQQQQSTLQEQEPLQYEILSNVFTNYQKKLQTHKNAQNNPNSLNNKTKSNSIQKQKSIESKQHQLIQDKQIKKTTRTDVSQTIQELNMKLEEIVTSHSLISSSQVLIGSDDDIQQFEFHELDEFQKFLNKLEKENLKKIKEKNPYINQLGQTISNELLNDQLNQENKKKINIMKNNQKGIKQNDPRISNDKHFSQNITYKPFSNNTLLQALQQQYIQKQSPKKQLVQQSQIQQQSIPSLQIQNQLQKKQQDLELLQSQKQYSSQYSIQQTQQITSIVHNNDKFRNNEQTSNILINNQSQFQENNQQQQQTIQPQQLKVCINKQMNSKGQKSEVQCFDQFRQTQDQNYDLQIIHQNIKNIQNDANKQNVNSSVQDQQIYQIPFQNNLLKKNNLQQISQCTKKRQTPQLKLDDIEYFNDNKVIQENQQLTGSLSVKFSNRDLLNLQQNPYSFRSARDQYPSTTTNKMNIKSSCENKQQGPLIQQTNSINSNSINKSKQQTSSPNSYDQSKKEFQCGKQQNIQISHLDQIFSSIMNKNDPNNPTSNSFALKLETKESQLITPRQFQIQSTTSTSSYQKNLFSKCNQILLTKSLISPRDSIPSLKNTVNNSQTQNENLLISNSIQNTNQLKDNVILSQNIVPSNQQPINKINTILKSQTQKSNSLKKKHKNKKVQISQFQQQSGIQSQQNTNQTILSNNFNNVLHNQNQVSNSVINSQTPNLNINQFITKKGNMKHLNLKLQLDQLNFSKEKVNIPNKQNLSSNQIIKEPLSQRSYSSKNLDQQTPKYNFYEVFKQQISNHPYSQIMGKPDIQTMKNDFQDLKFNQQLTQHQAQHQASKSSYSQPSQNYTLNFMNNNNLLQTEKKGIPSSEIYSEYIQNQNQQIIATPQQIKSNTIENPQISPSFKQNDLNNVVERVATNNSNSKSSPFININSIDYNLQINTPKHQQEQQKKVLSQQTTRSEVNTRKNSQIKFTQEKQQQSTVIVTGMINGANLNSKHVSRNSSLEINNSNVIKKKSPQILSCQQKESKNVYKLVQQLSNNFIQSTPKQTVSARNFQTQRNQINYFDFQIPEVIQASSQKQSQSIQTNSLQHQNINNSSNLQYGQSIHNKNLQQKLQNPNQGQYTSDSECFIELNQNQQNPVSINQNDQKSIKNKNAISSLSNQNSNYQTSLQTPSIQDFIKPTAQIQQNSHQKISNENSQQFDCLNSIIQTSSQNTQKQINVKQQSITGQNQQQQQQIQISKQQQQQNLHNFMYNLSNQPTISSPQAVKKLSNMHKHTKSENLMNLIIETNIQNNSHQQNYVMQTPNQFASPYIPTNYLQSNSTNKRIQKNQKQTQIMSNSVSTHTNSGFQQQINSSQMSPRLILNQNFSVQQGDKFQVSKQQNQIVPSNGCNQLLHKKQSLLSSLSTSSTQINLQVDFLKSTNNSTNYNNSNINNTNNQITNNLHSGVNNNSSSMNTQLNNNFFNSHSNNSATQQINSSLNACNNFVINSTNTNNYNQLNQGGLSISINSSNLQQNYNINSNNINSQKRNSQINGFFNCQQTNLKAQSSSVTSVANNVVSNNLLKITHDNTICNVNKKTKKKSMF